MKSKLLVVAIISISYFWKVETAPVLPKTRQFLEPLPGYIPVYIRPGNTPLEDINLDLAEAFHSYALKHSRIDFDRSLTQNVLTGDEPKIEDISSVDFHNINSPTDHEFTEIRKNGIVVHTHIQKIPKTH